MAHADVHPYAFRLRIHPSHSVVHPTRPLHTALHVLHCALHAANLSDLHVWEAAAAAAWGASVMPALRRDILAVVHVRPASYLACSVCCPIRPRQRCAEAWQDIPVGARAQLARAAPRVCCRWAAQWRCGELCLASLPSRATLVLLRCSPAPMSTRRTVGLFGGLPFVMKLGSGPMQAPPIALHTPARSAENRRLVFVLLHFPFGRRRCGRGGALRACAYMGDGGDSCSADAVPRNSRLVFRTRMVRTDTHR